jgi:hypothetical protein
MKSFGKFNSRLPSQPVQVERRVPFVRDTAYENSPGVKEALAAVDAKAPIILVTGRAGTGKTTLIQHLRNRPGGEFQAVVAPTGAAAMNACAQTILGFDVGNVFFTVLRRMNAFLPRYRKVVFPVPVPLFLWLPPSVACTRPLVRPMPNSVPTAFCDRYIPTYATSAG